MNIHFNLQSTIAKPACTAGTLFTAFLFFISINTSYSQSWNPITSGTNGIIYSCAVFNDVLYVGGNFSMAGGVMTNNIARWNGMAWSSLGTGTSNGTNGIVRELTVQGTNLIVAGDFTSAGGNANNHIASWDGSGWGSPLGDGMNGAIQTLAIYSGNLWAGGDFTMAGGIAANHLAKWTGSQWVSIGEGTNNSVYALAPYINDELIVAGSFTASGGNPVARIARFNNSGFVGSLGTGVNNGTVFALAVRDGLLYAGGSFTTVAGSSANRIAKWDGYNWFNVTSGTNNTVYSLNLSSNVQPGASLLVVGGLFTSAGGISANSIATWNGSGWGILGSGMTGGGPSVRHAADFRGTLVASGLFNNAGGNSAFNVAMWGIIPIAPSIVSPLCGATGVSVTPTLDWTDVSYAWRYGLQLSVSPNFNPLRLNISGIPVSEYTVPPGILNTDSTYYWRVNSSNPLGTSPWSSTCWFHTSLVGITKDPAEIPVEFKLYQNYPNPFNPTTKIKFDIPLSQEKGGYVKLIVYDILGKEVATLLNEELKPGAYEAEWNAATFPSGVYYYRITAGNFVDTKKLVLIK